MTIRRVVVTDRAKKDLRKAPPHVADKFALWARSVTEVGLEEVRKIPGYDDHTLSGDRKGQRAVRLSRLWRVIYKLEAGELRVMFVSVLEVTPHKY
jgi:proteic killer suppression protein